jgi:sugar phosphate isomerase/epimerase
MQPHPDFLVEKSAIGDKTGVRITTQFIGERFMLQTRREFLGTSVLAAGSAAAVGNAAIAADRPTKDDISLAAWSLNRSFFVGKKWRQLDLPKILREEFNINGLEMVNQFFENPVQRYLRELRKNADAYGVKLVLIMVDGEGDMIAKDKTERIQASISHRKWIDIAHFLGCHAIRCNLGGGREGWKEDKDLVNRAVESFSHLLEYAKGANLNIVIENHGGASSDGDILSSIMKAVNNPNFGTLPDFGNTNEGDDRIAVMRKLLPWAKGISVKAAWAPDGTHPGWDLEALIRLCKESGYHGFWGIESSFGRAGGPRRKPEPGAQRPPDPTPEELWAQETKGVKLTKAVLDRLVL